MKAKFLISVGLKVVFYFVISGQPSIARDLNYPSFEEAEEAIREQLIEQMPERLQLNTYQDNRSAEEVQEIQEMRRAWSRFSPKTSLFLGEWHGSSGSNNIFLAIYPSNEVPDRVCVLQFLAPNSYQFGIGNLEYNFEENSDGTRTLMADEFRLKVSGGEGNVINFVRVLHRLAGFDGEHLAQVSIDSSNEIHVGSHVAFPRPLRDPRTLVSPQVQSRINLRNFDIANCTTGFPQFRSGAFPTHTLNGTQTQEGVTFRFTGAYISSSPTSRSFDAYWVIENLSDRPFVFYPNRVTIETENGQAIECPDAIRPTGFDDSIGCSRLYVNDNYDPIVEPGESITGYITILQNASAIESTYLNLVEASIPPRRFHLPLGTPILINE